MTNGTTFTINTFPCQVIGKTEGGRIIVQTVSGMQINFDPIILQNVLDTKKD